MRSEDRDRALADVQGRVVQSCLAGSTPLDEILAESIYQERLRLSDEKPSDRVTRDKAFWKQAESTFRGSSERAQRELLADVVRHYSEEVVGNFDNRVYEAVTRVLPPALGVLLNAASPKRLMKSFPHMPNLDSALEIQGEVQHARRLHDIGTIILVPTHVSNLDSIIVGYALYRMGLPPFVYGAGLNLFANPMMSFFMHNLGAYTVDRKKRDPLYKQVLKAYATVTLELGYDNIFFPGGTRSRSGAVERKLKLGLMGTGLDAYVHNLKRKAPNPKLFIVPMTLSFQLVLEAETLIDDFLKEVGKSQYIITDDEFAQPTKVYEFVSHLLSLDSKIYVTLGRGFDPFGNDVDDDGNSLDPMGRVIDETRYVLVDGQPALRADRDAEYTREAGVRVRNAFLADNVLQSTHVTARAIFGLLRRRAPTRGLLRLIRTGGPFEDLELAEVYEATDRVLEQLRALAARSEVRLDALVQTAGADEVVRDGLKHFAIYHAQPAASRRGDRVQPTDRALLFYYQNRIEGYGVFPEPELGAAVAEDNRSLGRGARR